MPSTSRQDTNIFVDVRDRDTAQRWGRGDRLIEAWLSGVPSPDRGLAERNLNIMAERDDSPSKKRKAAEVDDYDENRELEATPRASRHGISIPLSSARSSQSTATRSPTKSSTSARSSSPVKRMADMVLRPAPTVLREFLRDYSSLPPDVREMLLRIQQFDRGIAVISPGCRVAPPNLAKAVNIANMNIGGDCTQQ